MLDSWATSKRSGVAWPPVPLKGSANGQAFIFPARGQDDVGTADAPRETDGPADAATGAGDESDAIPEVVKAGMTFRSKTETRCAQQQPKHL